MREWHSLSSRPTREALLFTLEHHDIGWTAEDATPTVDPLTGRPHDFIGLPVLRRHAVWHRALATLGARSTYAAALVAQHALTIYRHYRPDPEWAGFFADMERARDHWYSADIRPDGASGGPLDPQGTDRLQFLSDYGILRLGDIASLIVCNGWREMQEQDATVLQLVDDTLIVTPDPFEGRTIADEVPARRIAAAAYASDEHLRAALARAPTEMIPVLARGVAHAP